MKTIIKLFSIAMLATAAFACDKPEDKPAPEAVTVNPASIEATYEGKTEAVTVEANCEWVISADQAWVKNDYDASKGNSATFNVTIDANELEAERTATISFKSRNTGELLASIAVKQAGKPAPKTLTLEFDFALEEALEGWPVALSKKGEGTTVSPGINCIYPLDGVDYTFNLSDTYGAGSGQIVWSVAGKCFKLLAERRFMGLPAVEGMKLVKVVVNTVVSNATSEGAGITGDEVGDTTKSKDEYTYVDGGAKQIPAQKTDAEGKVLTYDLSGTEAGKVYRLFTYKGAIWFDKLTLTYTE